MEPLPEHCVGPESPQAGVAPGCAGCPNAKLCASGAARALDPDVPLIQARLASVQKIVLIMSGKGGVGKSSLSKEIACALADRHFRVGLLDADLCGPSLPRLTGGRLLDCHKTGSGIDPVWIRENLCLMSSHYLLSPEEKNEALLLRGDKKNSMIKMFLKDVEWGVLDFLIVDTPPGTSDEHLTLATLLKRAPASPSVSSSSSSSSMSSSLISGAIMITTPQRVAEADVRRELTFCAKGQIPVLGIVENMSGFICPQCHHGTSVFGRALDDGGGGVDSTGGPLSTAGDRLSKEFGIPLLARIPLDPFLMEACEEGNSLIDHLMNVAQQQEEEEVQRANDRHPSTTNGKENIGTTTEDSTRATLEQVNTSMISAEAIFSVVDEITLKLGMKKMGEEEESLV